MVQEQGNTRTRLHIPEGYEGPAKRCRYCGFDYPATETYFYKSKTGRHGLDSICRECKKEYEYAKARGIPHIGDDIELERKRKWFPWDGETLVSEAREIYQKTGEVPLGFRQCRRCLRILPQNKATFSLLPKNKFDPEAPRNFSGTCKACVKRRKKWKRTQRREAAEMVAAESRVEAEANMTPQQLQEAVEAHYGGFKPDRSGPTVVW